MFMSYIVETLVSTVKDGDVATKSDIKQIISEFKQDSIAFQANSRAEFREIIADMRSEFQQFRTEMRSEMRELETRVDKKISDAINPKIIGLYIYITGLQFTTAGLLYALLKGIH